MPVLPFVLLSIAPVTTEIAPVAAQISTILPQLMMIAANFPRFLDGAQSRVSTDHKIIERPAA